MFCKKCGAEIPDNAKFCDRCGSKIETNQSPSNFGNNSALPNSNPIYQPVQNVPADNQSKDTYYVSSTNANQGQQKPGFTKTKKGKGCLISVLIVVGVLVLCGIIGAIGGDEGESSDGSSIADTYDENESNSAVTVDENTPAATEKETTSEVTTKGASLGEINALQSAQSYLNMGGFSEESLRNQLEYEQFTSDEIDYAIKNCNADWNEQCVESAESYIDMGGFSRGSLYDQLEYEGFTDSQINYALDKIGY